MTNAVPLVAVDAIVLDCETTGLDTAKARMIQIGAVHIADGRLMAAPALDSLVAPGEKVPPETTAVHGITDAMLVGAPAFRDLAGEVAAVLGRRVVIGHAVGFDLAIIRREFERAGQSFKVPRSLDTRLLAQIANPRLPGYSIETIAGWLGVEVTGRHTALGDARVTAEIFLKLVPRLRDSGIRTVAEAELACRRFTEAIEQQHRAGWVEPSMPAAQRDSERTFARIDSYAFRHRVRDVMSGTLRTVEPAASLDQSLKRMVGERISSLLVTAATDAVPLAAGTGIVTERDVMRALARDGAAALARPVGEVMSSPVATIPADAFVYRAVGRMNRLGIRHLVAVDDLGRIVGVVSARDLLKLRAGGAVALGDALDSAVDVPALAAAFARLPKVAIDLVAEDVPIADVAAVISREIGALTRRAAMLAEERMKADGEGAPPCPYAVVVLGSAGRGDSLLAADQDNAIVFASGAPDGPEDRWFARLGDHLADILDAAGLPLCKGGVMARNPKYRGSLDTWRERIADWVRRASPEDLLAVDIVFDLRAVHGDGGMVRDLTKEAFEAGAASLPFLKQLAAELNDFSPPLTFFGGIRVEDGRVDLKGGGFYAIVTAARVLAIRHGILARGTRERLASLRGRGLGSESDLAAMASAYDLLQRLVLSQQVADLEAGIPLGNKVLVSALGRDDKAALKDALSGLANVPTVVRQLLA